MSKFIVKPNKTIEEITRLNKKHTQYLVFNHEIRSNKLKKERREMQLHRKYIY